LIAVGVIGSPVYTSTDSGINWTSNTIPNGQWISAASSADGTRLIIAGGGGLFRGPLYTSADSGVTWVSNTIPNSLWTSVASSADGTKLIAATRQPTAIYTSTNSGGNWTSNSAAPGWVWTSVASSSDGTKLVAVANGLQIIISTNSGAAWISNSTPPPYVSVLSSVASSADGSKLITATGPSFGGSVYSFQTTPTPQLNIASANTNLTLSWIVPATNFVLQQSSDLTLANWMDVTNTVVLNLTNLQDQVCLPLPNGAAFYRLKTP
jgi:hypothetical protein